MNPPPKEKRGAMNGTLPQWCADILSNPPRSGEGFHNWLFRAARGLWKCGRDENDIREVLENAAATCGRPVRDTNPGLLSITSSEKRLSQQDSDSSIFGRFRQSGLKRTNRTRRS